MSLYFSFLPADCTDLYALLTLRTRKWFAPQPLVQVAIAPPRNTHPALAGCGTSPLRSSIISPGDWGTIAPLRLYEQLSRARGSIPRTQPTCGPHHCPRSRDTFQIWMWWQNVRLWRKYVLYFKFYFDLSPYGRNLQNVEDIKGEKEDCRPTYQVLDRM